MILKKLIGICSKFVRFEMSDFRKKFPCHKAKKERFKNESSSFESKIFDIATS